MSLFNGHLNVVLKVDILQFFPTSKVTGIFFVSIRSIYIFQMQGKIIIYINRCSKYNNVITAGL